MASSLKKLCHVTSGWSNSELGLFLSALKRRLVLCSQLTKKHSIEVCFMEFLFVITLIDFRIKFQIREFMTSLMNVNENDLQGKPKFALRNPSNVLQRTSILEDEECRKINKKDPDPIYLPYAQMYRFFSSLVCGQPLPNLSDLSSAAFLDLLSCLVRVLGLINTNSQTDQKNKHFKNQLIAEQIQEAKKITTEKMGIFLALAGAIHVNARLCTRHGFAVSPENFNEHCSTPLFLLSKVKLPTTLRQARAMIEYLIERFMKIWSLPKFPHSHNPSITSEIDLDIKTSDDIPATLLKRVTMFSLNPLSLPMEVMSPLQNILDDFRRLSSSRFKYLSRFKSVLFISPPIEPTLKRSKPPQPIENNQRKRRRTEKLSNLSQSATSGEDFENLVPWNDLISLGNDTITNQVDSSVYIDKTTNSKVHLSSRRFVNWCPGTHFIRVSDPKEDETIKILVNKHIRVQTKRNEKMKVK
ncbi:hypothetical protein MN116_000854 [Schistosoma mekongi]|uniref:Uncharacterized protein n=1 Tax=Schistosoma mekongi TaxID=38744 RepID=A0AAE1ZKM3_SCHME|nr:hypothetical protein MN116_000854 [Schistosoma mekongi]